MAILDHNDEGKSVINADGEEVGTVANVQSGTAYVNPNPGLTDEIAAHLGWGDADEDTYQLDDSEIEAVTSDSIRLTATR